MHYILDEVSQEIFLDSMIEKTPCLNAHITTLISECPYYTYDVFGNCYSLSKSIIKKQKLGVNINNYIVSAFEITENTSFILDEFNDDFIEYLLKNHSIINSISLEDSLIEVLRQYINRYE